MDGGQWVQQAGHDTSANWYIVQLKPGGLERAKKNLARQGVESFMPKRKRTIRRANRLLNVERPLFPGYLFICVGEGAPPWRSINSTYGVAKAVCIEPGTPTRVPRPLMESLIGACSASEYFNVDREAFRVGEGVRVVSGPFSELIARVEAVPEGDSIYVLLDIMGRSVRANVAASDLERAH